MGTTAIRWAATCALTLAFACAGQIDGTGEQAVPTSATDDPFMVTLAEDGVLRQNTLERRAIFSGNWLATEVFSLALNAELGRIGVGARYFEAQMTPSSPPTSTVEWDGEPPAVSPAGVTADRGDARSCPFARPATSAGFLISCRFVVRQASDTAFVRLVQELDENPVAPELLLDAPNPIGVADWYENAANFGIGHSSVFAVEALRLASACDTTPTPVDSAFEMGIELGREAMQTETAAQETVTDRSRCDTDEAIITPARDRVRLLVPDIQTRTPLCPGFTPTSVDEAARLAEANAEVMAGVGAGIEEQAAIESGRLVRDWVCVQPQGNGGGGGDPVVLDLDGNGVHVEAVEHGPLFDYGATGLVRTEWPFLGDAFLVLDRNEDGQVQATELFGDVTITEEGVGAPDGFSALRLYDRDVDGRLDDSDPVFGRLQTWSDRDGDARVDDGELLGLDAQGIVAIDLEARRFVRQSGEVGAAEELVFEYLTP